MSLKIVFALLALSALGGAAIGYVFRWLLVSARKGSIEVEVKHILLDAREEAKKITAGAEEKAKEILVSLETTVAEKEEKVTRQEERVFKREEALDKKQGELDSEIQAVKGKIEEVKSIKERAEALLQGRASELAKVVGLSKDQAKEQLYSEIERENSEDFMLRTAKLERDGYERMERKAKDILVTAIHRLGNSVASDTMASAITIPIDDTPGSIVFSSYDPLRRAIARVALENLIIDGRIQPAKIEETVEKAKADVNKIIKEKAEAAAFEVGVLNLDPRLLMILGRLHFRTSYGQSVLQHSVEMAHIAGMIAEEVGANPAVARAGALLHDIGKALDHEVQGTHVEIGRRILQKFGVQEEVIKAMQAHHEEYPFETPESYIVQVADFL